MKTDKINTKKIIVEKDSYMFGSGINTDSFIDKFLIGEKYIYKIWLNGGNAFNIKVDETLWNKLVNATGKQRTEIEESIMKTVVKSIENNFDSIINKIIK